MKTRPDSQLVRLWGDNWEIWQLPHGVSALPVLAQSSSPKPTGKADRVLAIPARLCVAAPLWVDSVDPDVITVSIELELEMRGLLPRRKATDALFSSILQADGKTLVNAVVFPIEVPQPGGQTAFTHYEASPLLISPAQDAVMLWREGDDLVALFTRETTPVYWITTDWPDDSTRIRHWVEIVWLHLHATNVLLSRPHRLVIDQSLKDEGLSGLLADVPCEFSSFLPSVETAACKWKPDHAREAELRQIASRNTRKTALALALVYGAIILGALSYLGWLQFKSSRLQNQISHLEAQAGEFQPTVREWRHIGPGADADYFLLETLHHVVGNMPARGLRLTTYDVTGGRIAIEGEAESVSVASQFFTVVSKDESLQAMNWEMPTPSLLPSNAARFQLTGVIP